MLLSIWLVFVVIVQRREVLLVLLVPLPRKSGLTSSVIDESELKVSVRLRRRGVLVTVVDVRQSSALALRGRPRRPPFCRRRSSFVVARTLPVRLRRSTTHVEVVLLIERVLHEGRDREPRKQSGGLAPGDDDHATVRAKLLFW